MSDLRYRIIPIILWSRLGAVTGIQFKRHRRLGSLAPIVKLHTSREVDEMIFLDIRAGQDSVPIDIENLKLLSKNCFVPLTVGGGIDSVAAARRLIRNGADKIAVNSTALKRPELITELSEEFGSSSVVVSIDGMWDPNLNDYSCYVDSGSHNMLIPVSEWAEEAEVRGGGEILVCSIPHNGQLKGLDLDLVSSVTSRVSVPVIAAGGLGSSRHAVEAAQAGAQAVGASSVFQFTQVTPEDIKRDLGAEGYPVRNQNSSMPKFLECL